MNKTLRAPLTFAIIALAKILKTITRGQVAALFVFLALVAAVVSSSSSAVLKKPSLEPKGSSYAGAGKIGSYSRFGTAKSAIVQSAIEDQPTIAADKESYSSGETITFSGTNWAPGEVVTIVISDGGDSQEIILQASADDSGSFTAMAIMPASQPTSASRLSATKSDSTVDPAAANSGNGIYTATATGATSGATALVQFTQRASVNVPTPGCGAVLSADVIDYLTGKPTDPFDDYEAWRQEHPHMIEFPMPLQCQSEAWRVLHGLMAEPSTQAPEPLAPLSPSAGTDVDMAGGVQAYQGEVNIAVDPNNPLHLVAGANSFYRDPSAACQSPTGGSANTYGTQALYGSSDGGQTWTYKCAPWNPNVTSGITGAALWFGSDPAMAWDNAGNAYAVYMLISQNSAGTSSGASIVISKSTDNGTTWSNLGVIVNRITINTSLDDKEMVAIDTTSGQAHSHPGRIYVIWDEGNVERVAYSDNGSSWTTVVMGSGTEIGGNVSVAADGTVYAAWNHYSQTGGVGTGDSLYVKKSTDGGVTWTAPTTNPIVQHNLASFGSNNKPAAQDSRGINAFPIIDVDRNSASANFGKVYIAYNDFPPATGSGNNLNVYLINSASGGSAWSSQVLVNDDGGTSTQFFPWMSVDQSDGTVNMSWIDTRNFTVNNRQTQMYTARSINGGTSFEANVSVEDNGGNFRDNVNYSDDNTTDNSARNGNQYGDYEGVVATNRISHPIWTDTRNFYPSADTQSPARAEDAVACALTNCSAPSSIAAPSAATACSPSRVQITWSAPTGWGTNATNGTYSVYRSTTSTFPGGAPIVSGLTTTSYDDSSGTPGVAYYYFVEAKNNCPGTALTPMSTLSLASASVVFPPCGPTGVLQGTVTASGSPVSGATVTAGAYSTTTNASGFYQFPAIATGTYTVTASATGYNSASANNVSVTLNNTTVRDFALTPTGTSGCFTDTTQADFQAGIGTNIDLTASPGDVKLALTGSEAVDQQQTNTGNAQAASVSTVFWTGNTFTPGVSGRLTSLSVNLFYSSGTAGDIIVQIRTVSGGLPTSTVLGQPATITGSTGINGFVTATFSSPATLTAGTQYAYVLHSTNGVYGHRRRSNGAADYTGGTEIQSSSADAGYATVASDCAFQTFMTPTTYQTSGNLVSSLKDGNPVVGATTNWTTISWTPLTPPANTTITFQVAASNNPAGPFNFVGPFSNGASLSQFNGFRYLKYTAFLSTTNTTVTPALNDVTICYNTTASVASTSLTVSAASGAYGGTANLSATLTSSGNPVSGKTISFTLNGSSAGSAVTNASGVATVSNASLSGINAGSYPSGVGGSFAGDGSYSGSSGSNSLTVSKATPTITWSNPANIVYGTALSGTQLNATASVPGSFVYTPAAGTVLHAGNGQNLHVDFTPTDTTNYNNTSKGVSINVTKATLTVTADDESKSYRAGNPTLTYTPTGFVNGDTASVLSGVPSLSTTAVTNSNVGTYPITITVGTLSAADYSFSFVNGTLTVTKATPTINWSNPADITYGTALSGTQLNATTTNPNDGSSVAGSFTYSPGSGTVLNAGNGQTLATNFAPTDTANYNTPAQKTVLINVNKANPTVNATGGTFIFDGSPHAGSGSATGGAGESLTVTLSYSGTGSTSYGPSATAPTNAGSYQVVAHTDGDSNNNSGDSSPAALTISKASSTTTVDCTAGAPFTYTGSAITPCTATTTGAGGLSVSVTPVNYTNNVNAAAAIASATYGGDANHDGSTGNGGFTIDKASSITVVTCGAGPFTYDGSAITPCTATATGAGGLSVLVTPVNYANNVSAGAATANATYSGDANHEGSTGNGGFTIDKASSTTTVTCGLGPFTYNGSAQTPCTANVIGAGSLNQALTVSYLNNTNAGTATASATYAGDANHDGSNDSKNFTIDKATAAIVVTGFTGVYDGNAHGVISSSATGVNSEALAGLVIDPTPYTNVPGGLVHWTFTNANYGDQEGNATVSIGQAASTTVVTCPSTAPTYTGSVITPCSVTVTGANLSLTTDPDYTNNINAGTDTASASYTYPGDPNHTGSSDSKTFSIAKASSITTVTCDPGPFTYNGSAQTSCTANVTGAGDLNQVLTVNYTDNTNAGTATASASFDGDANHSGSSDSKNFNINKATANITLTGFSGIYDGNAHGVISSSAIGVNNEALSGLAIDGTTYTNVPGGLIHWTFSNANYGDQPGDATVTITRANQYITFGAINDKTFGNADFAINATADSGLTVSLVVTSGPCTLDSPTSPANVHINGAGTCAITASQSGNGNYNAAPVKSRSFDVAKANQTITFNALADKTFGDSDFAVSATGGGSGNPITFTASGNCTVSGSSVHIIGAGSCTITASQSGDNNYNPAPDVSRSFSVNKASSTTTVSCPSSVTYTGSALAPCTASVTGVGGLSQSLTVNYANNVNAGMATASASYGDDANHIGSSDSKNFSIVAAGSITTIVSNKNPSAFGDSVTFTATISPSTATGTVQFKIDGNNFGLPVTIVSGSATSSSTSLLPVGSHSVAAVYSGDNNFAGSTGNLTQIVARAVKITGGGSLSQVIHFGFNVQPVQENTSAKGFKGHVEFHDLGLAGSTDDLKFKSTSISGEYALDNHHGTFTGAGGLNGVSGYLFTVTIEDNAKNGAGNDKFRIQITNPGNSFNYDSNTRAIAPDGVLSAGKIKIHYDKDAFNTSSLEGTGSFLAGSLNFDIDVQTDGVGGLNAGAGVQFTDSTNSYTLTSVSIDSMKVGGTVTVSGQALLNGVQGYKFQTDWDTGKTTLQLRVWDSTGKQIYDSKPNQLTSGSCSFTASN